MAAIVYLGIAAVASLLLFTVYIYEGSLPIPNQKVEEVLIISSLSLMNQRIAIAVTNVEMHS